MENNSAFKTFRAEIMKILIFLANQISNLWFFDSKPHHYAYIRFTIDL